MAFENNDILCLLSICIKQIQMKKYVLCVRDIFLGERNGPKYGIR